MQFSPPAPSTTVASTLPCVVPGAAPSWYVTSAVARPSNAPRPRHLAVGILLPASEVTCGGAARGVLRVRRRARRLLSRAIRVKDRTDHQTLSNHCGQAQGIPPLRRSSPAWETRPIVDRTAGRASALLRRLIRRSRRQPRPHDAAGTRPHPPGIIGRRAHARVVRVVLAACASSDSRASLHLGALLLDFHLGARVASSCWTRWACQANAEGALIRLIPSPRAARSSSVGASARPRPRMRPRCTRFAIDAAELSPMGSSKGAAARDEHPHRRHDARTSTASARPARVDVLLLRGCPQRRSRQRADLQLAVFRRRRSHRRPASRRRPA